MPEDVNTEDLNITSKSGNFNIETGMWEYPSLSQHKPMEMHDVQLVQNTKLRSATSIKEDGIFTLKPCLQSLDGSLKRCECGEVYTEEELAGVATLYIRIGAM